MTRDLTPPAPIGRRGLLLGAGAAALAVGAVGTAQRADAAPAPAAGREFRAKGALVSTTIASAPISGYTYRTVCMYDFEPFDPAAKKTWGGSGTYSATVSTAMRATLELPAGALVRDVEYYVYNNSSGSVTALSYLYVAGQGLITSLGADATITATGTIQAVRAAVASSNGGPFPQGSRLLISLSTPTDGSIQINGARVGYGLGSGEAGLLAVPFRAYDSRHTGGKLHAASTRTITLPSSIIAPGTTGALLNITAVGASHNGYLKAYAAGGAVPVASALNFVGDGTAIANAITVTVSSARQIKIYASQSVDVIVDVTGTIA